MLVITCLWQNEAFLKLCQDDQKMILGDPCDVLLNCAVLLGVLGLTITVRKVFKYGVFSGPFFAYLDKFYAVNAFTKTYLD